MRQGPDPARRRTRYGTSTTCAACRSSSSAHRRGRSDNLFPTTNIHRRRPAAARRDRRVLQPHQGRQGRAGRRRLRDHHAHRGVHRRLGARRGAEARRGLSRGGLGRHPDPQRAVAPDRSAGLQEGMGRSLAGRDRADQVPLDADRRFPRGRVLARDLGESPAAFGGNAMQETAAVIARDRTCARSRTGSRRSRNCSGSRAPPSCRKPKIATCRRNRCARAR